MSSETVIYGAQRTKSEHAQRKQDGSKGDKYGAHSAGKRISGPLEGFKTSKY